MKEALSCITLGTYVIGVRDEDTENLMTAAWLTQVSSNPPCIAVAVSRKHLTADMIEQSGRFTVSVLADGQYGEAYRCGTVSGREKDKTAEENVLHDAWGIPMMDGAAAHLSCRMKNIIRVTDHVLFIGEVTAADATDKKCMIYDMGKVMSLGKGKA